MAQFPKTFQFFGSGIGFPFRLNAVTKGVIVTTGNTDSISVALEYLQDNWTIREDTNPSTNHIAESIAHILLTVPGEHDTLPEFGSRLFFILFEPDTQEFRNLAETYFKFSTIRWEKRAKIPDPIGPFNQFSGVQWIINGRNIDMGILPVYATVQFIANQVPGNLVIPFISNQKARLQEYPSTFIDINSYDYQSRYKNKRVSVRDGNNYIRLSAYQPIPFSADDQYHPVTTGDTWLLLSWKYYGDIRFWYIVARCYVSDCADAGLNRSCLSMLGNPPNGSVLRIPSKTSVLRSISG